MWRVLQGIPRGLRGNLNGSVIQSAPQSVCRDDEKDGDFRQKSKISVHKKKGSAVHFERNENGGKLKVIHKKSEWQDWKKAHLNIHYWKHTWQNCRFIEALGWSSVLLLGCNLSQLLKFKHMRDGRRQIAEDILSRKFNEAVLKQPSSAFHISDSTCTNGENVESDVSKIPPHIEGPEDPEETHDTSADPRIKKTPVAWAVSEFPSLWGQPLLVESKFPAKLNERLQADSVAAADRDDIRQSAKDILSRSFYEAVFEQPSSAVYVSDTTSTNGKNLASDVTWPKSPPDVDRSEYTDKNQDVSGNPRIKKTPVAWAVSEFPSLWGQPLLVNSKFLPKVNARLGVDSAPAGGSSQVDSWATEEDCSSDEEDLEHLCNSIKYNREGNRFARKGDFEKAILCWQKAGRSGSAKANFNLGLCYEIGSGVPADEQKAVEYYTKASSGGSAVAAYNLALLYLNEANNDKIAKKKAETLLKQASKQGLVEAQVELGVLCTETGEMDRAAHYFSQASLQKDSSAEYYLGLCYENGLGVTANMCKAAELYSRASKQGHPSAQFSLANFFEHGLGGLPVDKPAACNLYEKSSKGGYYSAAKNVARLRKQLKKTSDLSPDESIGMKISASVPLLTSYLKNHLPQLGKLELEWSPMEVDRFHKASTLGDFRQLSTGEHSRDQLPLFNWDDTGNEERREDVSEQSYDLTDSSSEVKFDLGEGDSEVDALHLNPELENYFSLSGQFGDFSGSNITSYKTTPALHRSASFDRLSSTSDESDTSEFSIVFDDNFEGFRLVQNNKVEEEREIGAVSGNNMSGLGRVNGNNYSNFEMFEGSWSLNEMSSDMYPSTQALACN